MKNPVRQKYIVECVSRVLKFELKQLCSDNFPSIIRSTNVDNIMQFKWGQVIKEAEQCTPFLLKVLKTCTETPTKRDNTTAIIGCIISILAKHRRPHSCLFQRIVSLLLYSGHCSKKVRVTF